MKNKLTRRQRRLAERAQFARHNGPPVEARHYQRNELRVMQQQYFQISQSPLPDPEMLARYKEVRPDLIDHLLAEQTKQSSHRQSLEILRAKGGLRVATTGQYLAAGLSLALFALAGYAVSQGQQAGAVLMAATDVLAVAGAFVTGRVLSRRNEARQPPEPPKAIKPGG